jgi:hypothetical protein
MTEVSRAYERSIGEGAESWLRTHRPRASERLDYDVFEFPTDWARRREQTEAPQAPRCKSGRQPAPRRHM